MLPQNHWIKDWPYIWLELVWVTKKPSWERSQELQNEEMSRKQKSSVGAKYLQVIGITQQPVFETEDSSAKMFLSFCFDI